MARDKENFLPRPPRPKWLFVMQLFLFLMLVFAVWAIVRFVMDGGKENVFVLLNNPISRLASNVVNLEIIGHDNKQRLYVLTATSATPKEDSAFRNFFAKEGSLSNLEISMEWQKDNWFSMYSSLGRFNHQTKRLFVGPAFNLYFSNGYQLKGLNASIDLQSNAMIIQGEVEGWGPFGEISAAAMDAEQGGEYMRFYGGVEVLLFVQEGEN